jgi:acylphosphatase
LRANALWLYRGGEFASHGLDKGAEQYKSKHLVAMSRKRMHIFYAGNVQGVGFRYQAKSVASGYEVAGVIRNLADGRVELVAEGAKEELEAFRQGIRDSGMEGLIRQEQASWGEATGEFRGFEIVR